MIKYLLPTEVLTDTWHHLITETLKKGQTRMSGDGEVQLKKVHV